MGLRTKKVQQIAAKMESDDESYENNHDDSSEEEMDVDVCGKKHSSFEALSAMEIVNLMNQYIDDVKSVVQVSCSVELFSTMHFHCSICVEMLCSVCEN